MRNIQIDDEVFAYLQHHSEPLVDTPNDVLRRILLDGKKPPSNTAGRTPTGLLLPLIRAGLVAPGDQLRHHQPRRKRTHEAIITENGCVELPDGQRFEEPSPALKSQVGSEISGWRFYTHVPTGRTLRDLRDEADLLLQKP